MFLLTIIFLLILILLLGFLVIKKNENFDNKNKKKINNNLYLCYKNKDIPKYIEDNLKKLNPNIKIHLYDDNDCKHFLKTQFNDTLVDVFNYIKDGPIKADFWRCCILYKYGGIYSDIDIKPVVSFDKIIVDYDIDFLTIRSGYKENTLTPQFIYSKNKNNKLLGNCIDTYLNFYKNNTKYSYWGWSICTIMTDDMNKILKNKINSTTNTYYDKDNKKYKLLDELIDHNDRYNDRVVNSNNEILLYNRYREYSNKNHTF